MPFPKPWLDFAAIEQPLSAIEERVSEFESEGIQIFPSRHHRYSAFELVPPDAVKVVIVGQDPYHGIGEAHGLAFSVLPGIKVPPSLRNIFKELRADLGIVAPGLTRPNGHLEAWARQGVLLMNAMLSVEKNAPGSHRALGWERVTDRVIKALSEKREGIVFLLWGNFAKAKAEFIDSTNGRHLAIATLHPSPIGGSCNRGFFGSRPFSRMNEYLRSRGVAEIDWRL